MPERLAKTDPMSQVSEAMGSGPFKFVAVRARLRASAWSIERNDKYVPRKDGKPSFNAGPKVVYVDRVVWNFIPDPATASAALTQGEIDWWENPTIDLVPQIKTQQGHHAGGEGPHRRDRLSALQPPASAVRQRRDPPRRGRGDGPEGDHGGGRRRRTVADQDRCRRLRAGHADGEHGRRRGHARAEGLRQAQAGSDRRRLQGREGRHPRGDRRSRRSGPRRRLRRTR